MLSNGSNSSAGEESALRQNEKEVKIATEQAGETRPSFASFRAMNWTTEGKRVAFLSQKMSSQGKLRKPK